MNIVIQPMVMMKLMAFANATAPKEFSGFGFVTRKGSDLEVYDYVVLNVGSEGYTEIAPKKLIDLMSRPDYPNMKLWFHRHPIDNWSSRDLATILTEPLGGVPEMVKWSASIVLTPKGWIGRVDNYVTKTNAVCSVLPSLSDVYDIATQLYTRRNDWWDIDEPKKNAADRGSWSDRLETLSIRLGSLAQDLEVAQDDLEEMLTEAQDVDEGDLEEAEIGYDQYLSEDFRDTNRALIIEAREEQESLVRGVKHLARR